MACLRVSAFALAFIISITGGIWAGPAAAACPSCLSLKPAEWRCLKSRLDRYQGESVDPVLASVLSCDQTAAAPMTTRLQDPRIAPQTPANAGAPDPDAPRKVFFLTKVQINCLKRVIDDLAAGFGDGLIDFDLSRCLPAAQ